jgi:tetratricopeptide (TPR) repeat protein
VSPCATLPLLLASLLLHAASPPGDARADAETLLAAGKADEARARIEEALGAAPAPAERALLQELLGRALRALDRPWDAEAAFGRALEDDPALAAAALGRGEVFLDLSIAAASGARPSGAEVRALAADARTWLAKAAEALPGQPRPLAGLARAALLGEDHASAEEAALRLLAAAPKDPGARRLLASARRAAGDPAGAAAAEAEALSLDPSLAAAAAARVGDLAAAGDRPAAAAAAREFLLGSPDADPVYQALWRVEGTARRFAAMEETILAILDRNRDHPRALYYLGYTRASAGNRDGALDAYRRKAEVDPGSVRTRVLIGNLLAGKGDLAGAEAEYERAFALGLDPGSAGDGAMALAGLSAVGTSHGLARRYGDAERVFRRVAELDPGSPEPRMFLGLSLRRLGKHEEAEAAFRQAIDLSPFDGLPSNELGLLHLGRGRMEEAVAAFRASAEIDSRNTPAVENLGNLARAAGRHAEALEWYREGHRRACAFRDEPDRLKFRRYLDATAREAEAAENGRR